jgi:hypothetical protein
MRGGVRAQACLCFDPHLTAPSGGAAEIAAAARQFGVLPRLEGRGGAHSLGHGVKSYLVDWSAHLVGNFIC